MSKTDEQVAKENAFLDMLEWYIKQHKEYWERILATCLVNDPKPEPPKEEA
jgi:hypothetical protein